jgi:hypothetical protein
LIKCPKCGIEYSYGRKLCHACKDMIIFSGAILDEDRKNYTWNSSCIDEKLYNTNVSEVTKCLDLKKVEPILYEWNFECNKRLRTMVIGEKNNNYQFTNEDKSGIRA